MSRSSSEILGGDVGIVEVTLLLVISEAFNAWSSLGCTPFEDMSGVTKDKLRKQQTAATASTVAFGLLASVVVGNYTPLIAGLLFSGLAIAVYNYEWNKDNGTNRDTATA